MRTKIVFGHIVLGAIFCVQVPVVYATLSSQNYTFTSHRTGTQESGVLTSPNYTLTTAPKTVSYGGATVDTPAANTTSGGRGSSRFGTSTSDQLLPIQIVETPREKTVILPRVTSAVPSGTQLAEVFPGTVLGDTTQKFEVDDDGVSSRVIDQRASVMGASVQKQFEAFRDAWNALFASREARAVGALIVLSLLWYVRTYTEFGKKYRPF